MSNFIENFLYQNAPANMPKGYYGQFPMSEGFKSELGLSKRFPYEGFSTKYQGPDKTGFIDYAKKGLQSIFGNVPNTGIGGGTVGQRIIYENLLRQLGNAGRFANIFARTPVIGAASDALFGTNYTMSAVNDINNLFNMFTPTQQTEPEPKPKPKPTIAQQQAQTQQNIINQINQANQNNQGGGGGGNVSGPAGMSGPSSSASSSAPPRGPDLRFRAQGGIVSINDMIGRM